MAAHSDSLIMAYSNPAMDLSHESNDRNSYEMRRRPSATEEEMNRANSEASRAATVHVIKVETHSNDTSSLHDDVTSSVANQDSSARDYSASPSADSSGRSVTAGDSASQHLSPPTYDNQAFLSDSGCDASSDVTHDVIVNEEDEVTSL